MRKSFLNDLKSRVLILDGAMGTEIEKRGLSLKTPTLFNISHPEIIKKIHLAYLTAGADIIETNTFSANSLSLKEQGLESKLAEINKAAVEIALQARDEKQNSQYMQRNQKIRNHIYIAGSIGPSSKIVGKDITFDEAFACFYNQMRILYDSGVDLFIIETMNDIYEAKAAVLAAKEFNLPIICSMTYDIKNNNPNASGTDPKTAISILEPLGIDVIGTNCSNGPEDLVSVVNSMCEYTNLPILVYPNAGLPFDNSGKIEYNITPEEFLKYIREFVSFGVNIVGGCCGTTPEHIKKIFDLREQNGLNLQKREIHENSTTIVASRYNIVSIGEKNNPTIIGERINTAGKKKTITNALMSNNISSIRDIAEKQINAGAKIIDVNLETGITNEIDDMTRVISDISKYLKAVVCIDKQFSATKYSDNTIYRVIEEALKSFPGRAIVNSVQGIEKDMAELFPLVKKYGSAVIALTMDENGLPNTVNERFDIAKKILGFAEKYGLKKNDLLIDCCVSSLILGHDPLIPLKTAKLVKEELGLNTILGLSNISSNVTEVKNTERIRSMINAGYLAMAIEYGVDCVIANPFGIEEKKVIRAEKFLIPDSVRNVIVEYTDPLKLQILKAEINQEKYVPPPILEKTVNLTPEEDLKESIIKSRIERIEDKVKVLLEMNYTPKQIVDNFIIPAMKTVGEKFERGEIYQPHLIGSADCFKASFSVLKPYFKQDNYYAGRIILATVEGDLHETALDIVECMMMGECLDIVNLGKNVPAEKIIYTIGDEKIKYVGLSSFISSANVSVKRTIALARQTFDKNVKIIVGGAALNLEVANIINADAYAATGYEGAKIVRGWIANDPN